MRILTALLVALLFAFPARAEDGASKSQAQHVITSQLQAFEREDATTAYAQASPVIQGMFPGADTFMAMVRGAYAPVYRHKSFDFGEARESPGKLAQTVRLVDEQGVPWDALYTLEQQDDGSWKISGCILLKSTDLPA